jgi:periplasmic copper chaperone A
MDRRIFLVTPLALVAARIARAETVRLGSIIISHPWCPPSVKEAAAMFMELHNEGPRPDRLIAASTPVAGTMILRSRDGVALDYYDLLPKRPVSLRPGRRYIALRDLKGPLALDDTFPVTLRFAEAGSVTVTATVEAGPEDEPPGNPR